MTERPNHEAGIALKHFPDDLLDKLQFQRICERVASHCLGEEGRARALNLQPDTDAEYIRLQLAQTAEMVQLLTTDDVLPFSHLPFVGPYLKQAAVEGAFLESEAFFRLRLWLLTVRKLKAYLTSRKERYPVLAELLNYARGGTEFTDAIDLIIGPDGQVKNSASPELARIREQQIERAEVLRRLLDRILRKARSNGWADDKELTIRNDRLVIPLNSDFRGKVEGFVQDVSASGRTVFVEPVEALSLNNEIRSLYAQERSELIRILTKLTDKLRPQIPMFEEHLEFVTLLDFARARGKLAVEMEGQLPALQPRFRRLVLIDAYHPLLLLQNGRSKVVPISLELTPERPVLIISGPNAGGKTVALQTVALCQLMLQCGLLPPLGADSQLPVFRKLMLDMGDNQSIQNNLSTYSSHLVLMNTLLKELDGDSLFLLDEFGDGTDPLLGGAIAEAILEDLVLRRAAGIITTHYANLKEFAQKSPVVSNASMEFDIASLLPTYRLKQGLPGSSYALEIGQRVGIPQAILDRARQKIGGIRSEGETLLIQLRGQEAELRRTIAAAQAKEAKLDEQRREMKESLQKAELKRKELLQEAREEAAYMLKEANRRIEETIREIREQQAEALKTKALRKKLAEALPLPEEEIIPDAATLVDTDRPPLVGDRVRLVGTDTIGQLTEVQDKIALVAFGELRTRLAYTRLVRVTEAPTTTLSPALERFTQHQLARTAELKPSLDLRGLRAEAALTLLDRYMDDALLANLATAEIIHGKGSGVLRKAIRAHLAARFPTFAFADGEEPGRGTGVTLVRLK